MTKQIDVATAHIQLCSATGDGMNCEMCCGTPDGKLSDVGPYPIATFRSDIEGQIKFVVETPEGIVSLPLPELEKAINVAKREVHCEGFYPYPEDTE